MILANIDAQWGEMALAGAMAAVVAVLMAAFTYALQRSALVVRLMRLGQVIILGCLSVASWQLLSALLDDNFSLAYVSMHSEKTLAWGYKMAAFWAGQEGSILLWAWLLAVMSVLMALRLRKMENGFAVITLSVMTAATGFFTLVMLCAANPFKLSAPGMTSGMGLNPALQNLAMVFHPPMLFLGYAGFTAPFAYMVAGLVTGRRTKHEDAKTHEENGSGWLTLARPWMVYSWITLTVGILLGAQWAYMELGWGGYWAWDPVENASLLPWLTGTALLHSAILQQRRGMFKRWTALLTAASFFLCVLGTYLTRSGVIESVHAFEQSTIGYYFLGFLGVLLAGSVTLIVAGIRTRRLDSEHQIESFVSREGTFMLGNVLLAIMTLTVTVGTLYPLISHNAATWINKASALVHAGLKLNEAPVTVNQPFYNHMVLPMALVLAALMATGPVLGSGAGALGKARTKLGGMLLGGFAVMVLAGMWQFGSIEGPFDAWGNLIWNFFRLAIKREFSLIRVLLSEQTWLWMQAAMFVVGSVGTGIVIDVALSLKTGNGVLRAITLRHRHWGAQLAHLGLAAIVAGVAGSSLFQVSKVVQLHTGVETASKNERNVDGFLLTLGSMKEERRANHTAFVATVNVTGPRGEKFTLMPERRAYDSEPEQSATVVALRPGIFSDVYMTLEAADQSTVTIKTLVNPLVNWIWAGGVLLTLGGLVCLMPQKVVSGQVPVASEEQTTAQAHGGNSAAHGRTRRERERALVFEQSLLTTGRRP